MSNVRQCNEAFMDGEFETGWNLYNRWNHRVFHCRCAEEFKACLKKVRRASAQDVGRLYFDVLQPSCFRLVDTHACRRWDPWFTSCLETGLEDYAHFFPSPKYKD